MFSTLPGIPSAEPDDGQDHDIPEAPHGPRRRWTAALAPKDPLDRLIEPDVGTRWRIA